VSTVPSAAVPARRDFRRVTWRMGKSATQMCHPWRGGNPFPPRDVADCRQAIPARRDFRRVQSVQSLLRGFRHAGGPL